VGESRINYTPRADAKPGSELSALAAVYSFALDRHAHRKAAGPAEKSDSRDTRGDSDKHVSRIAASG
jgi:hypothetical protein